MKVLRDLGECPLDRTVLTMGNYDGVHRGHRAVIAALEERADTAGGVTALITYEPHTLYVVKPEIAPKLLTTTERKLELLEGTGLDVACVLTFDEARSNQEPEGFVKEILAGCLHAREVVVGADTRFGHRARGDLDLLQRLGEEYDFVARSLDLVVTDGREKISSTRVRQALARGDVQWAAWALERPHEVIGPVVHGDQRGAKIGFPTANVDAPLEMCLPGDGVYVGWALLRGTRLPAVVNVGKRPTFYEDATRSLVEAHLLDFDDDIYGATLTVEFLERIRPELRFDGVSELVAQIGRDAEEARRRLGL
jgi:riboflavin kinase/FMN adenylyltransferase